jgi:hypothetical protein
MTNRHSPETVRMELLRWLDRSGGWAGLPGDRRRRLAGNAARVLDGLGADLDWLRPRDDEGDEDGPAIAALRAQLAVRLGLDRPIEEDEDVPDGDAPGFEGFVTELVDALMGWTADADGDALLALSELLDRHAADMGTVPGGEAPAARRRAAATLARFAGLLPD